ncbi:MAG: ABC transporter permease [Burkholderiaceae bacterium]
MALENKHSGKHHRTEGVALRNASVAGVCCVVLPMLAGLSWFLSPAMRASAWRGALGDPQLMAALKVTLMSALGSTVLALALATAAIMLVYPSAPWVSLRKKLPALLAFPHAAFAIGVALLVAPTGWMARLLTTPFGWNAPPQWVTVQDAHGLTLMVALAIKESWFLLWMLAATLGEKDVAHQMTLARSLGYGRMQAWWNVLLPQILPKIAWPLVAVLAYGLSVVDMALVLGPTTPPTLAVLTWQWLSDPNLQRVADGTIATLLLAGLLSLCVVAAWLVWTGLRKIAVYPRGRRCPSRVSPTLQHATVVLVLALGVFPGAMLLLWSFASTWFFPAVLPANWTLANWVSADLRPLLTTFWLATACVALLLPLTLVWLEWGPARYSPLIYTPLLVPALPLAAAQYSVLVQLRLDGTAAGVIWSHLAWVLPYMLITLTGPYRAFDHRILTTARALGYSRWLTCLTVKWPMLLRPIAASAAIGFSVSVAEYLPTLFAGAGRFQTVTTEAVALSAGGDRRILAVQSTLQMLLPLLAFALAVLIPQRGARAHRGMR